jgi:hypothetical protein
MNLTTENYHSFEANKDYMSNSQYGKWMECEARAYAQYVTGDYKSETTKAMLKGSFVHAYFEGKEEFEKFKSKHPEMHSHGNPANGLLKAFADCLDMIATVENDPVLMEYLSGESEKTFTAEFAGVVWKCRIDNIDNKKLLFSDIKTCKSITEKKWKAVSDNMGDTFNIQLTFIEYWNYWRQFAVYSEIERISSNREQRLRPYMVAVSSETVPDKALIRFDDMNRINQELSSIRDNMPRIINIKKGIEDPNRCGMCDYCKSTKVITGPVWPDEIGV